MVLSNATNVVSSGWRAHQALATSRPPLLSSRRGSKSTEWGLWRRDHDRHYPDSRAAPARTSTPTRNRMFARVCWWYEFDA